MIVVPGESNLTELKVGHVEVGDLIFRALNDKAKGRLWWVEPARYLRPYGQLTRRNARPSGRLDCQHGTKTLLLRLKRCSEANPAMPKA